MMATVTHESGLVATHYHSFSGPDFFEQTSMRFVFDVLRVDVNGWIPMSGRLTAIVNQENESELARLPGFRVTRRASGPEILGPNWTRAAGGFGVTVAGRPFEMDATVEGEFGISETKSEAYARALRALMADFVSAIDDSDHALRVTLEDGIASLETAITATENAHRRSGAGF